LQHLQQLQSQFSLKEHSHLNPPSMLCFRHVCFVSGAHGKTETKKANKLNYGWVKTGFPFFQGSASLAKSASNDVEFLAGCTAREATKAVWNCEAALRTPIKFYGIGSCM